MSFLKNVKDLVTANEMWKAYIRTEDQSEGLWRANWGWMLDEYAELKKKLDEMTKDSKFLTDVMEKPAEDPRDMGPIPNSTNHMYGWIAAQEQFVLEKYGSDYFKPLPLPSMYDIPKTFKE